MHSLNKIEQEIRLKAVFDSVMMGIMVINQHGIIETSNQAIIRLLGYTEKELIGKKFRELLSEKSRKPFDNYLYHYPVQENDEMNPETIELFVKKKKGSLVPIEFSITPPMQEYNHLFVALIHDISQRKRLEREVVRQIETKEAIEEKLEKEQELSELKSRFVSMASHEFRTPLAGILSSLNLVERYLNAEADAWEAFPHQARVLNHFEKIKESVRNLTSILNEFLSLAKLEEGIIKCKWETFDLNELITAALEELQTLCRAGQKISYHFEGKETLCELDYNMTRNIINNLVSNAIKYSGDKTQIFVRAGITQEKIRLDVKDQGVGIPDEEQQKLFGRFFRAKNVTNIQGTGLGLNIVKKYLDLMGGSISFISKQNEGTTFTVHLPTKKP